LKAKRIRTQEAKINKAQKEKEFYGGINDIFTETATAGDSTVTAGTYSNNKKKE
jgi:CRISPR/Cas system-associated protein Csm6